MKTALIFLVVAILMVAGGYLYYLSIAGTPLEELFNQAVGLGGEEEESNGFPIVVSFIPYIAVIALLVGIGIFLHDRGKKKAKASQNEATSG